MTEEEYFRKTYSDYCYGDRLLSPYWDLFQDGVEFGECQSEKKIKELGQKLEQTEQDLADYQFNYPTIKELEKENRLLGERCNQLLKDKGELTDMITQIQDAKCTSCTELGGMQLKINRLEQQIQDIIGMLNDILWKCTCKEYKKATQELKELINKWEIKENAL